MVSAVCSLNRPPGMNDDAICRNHESYSTVPSTSIFGGLPLGLGAFHLRFGTCGTTPISGPRERHFVTSTSPGIPARWRCAGDGDDGVPAFAAVLRDRLPEWAVSPAGLRFGLDERGVRLVTGLADTRSGQGRFPAPVSSRCWPALIFSGRNSLLDLGSTAAQEWGSILPLFIAGRRAPPPRELAVWHG